MWFARQSAKADCSFASPAGTRQDLKASPIHSREPGSKMTRKCFRLETVIIEQSDDAGRAQSITRHMKRLSFASKPSSSFSMNLDPAQMGALSIASIHLGIMNQATCGGRQ